MWLKTDAHGAEAAPSTAAATASRPTHTCPDTYPERALAEPAMHHSDSYARMRAHAVPHMHMCAHTSGTHAHINLDVHTQVSMHVHARTHTHSRTHTHARARTYAQHAAAQGNIRTQARVPAHARAHTHTHAKLSRIGARTRTRTRACVCGRRCTQSPRSARLRSCSWCSSTLWCVTPCRSNYATDSVHGVSPQTGWFSTSGAVHT